MQIVNSNYRVVEFDIPYKEHDEKYEQFGMPDPNDKKYGVACKFFFMNYYVCNLNPGYLTSRKITQPFYTRDDEDYIKGGYLYTLEDAIALCEYCTVFDTPSAAWGRVKNRVRNWLNLKPVHQTFTVEDAKAELAFQMLSKETKNV